MYGLPDIQIDITVGPGGEGGWYFLLVAAPGDDRTTANDGRHHQLHRCCGSCMGSDGGSDQSDRQQEQIKRSDQQFDRDKSTRQQPPDR